MMSGLGCTYAGSGGRPDKAEPLLASALKGLQVVLQDKHPGTLVTRQVLAIVLLRLNRLPEAEQEARQSYEDMQTVYGEMHPYTYTSQATLIQVYLAQGRRDGAAPLVRNLLANARRHREKMPVFALGGIGGVGHALLRERDFVEAESFLRVYLDLTAKQPFDDRFRFPAESALGACLLGRKKYAEAEPFLLAAVEGMKADQAKRPGEYKPGSFLQQRQTEALGWLVEVYDATGKPDKAAEWRKELEAVRRLAKGGKP